MKKSALGMLLVGIGSIIMQFIIFALSLRYLGLDYYNIVYNFLICLIIAVIYDIKKLCD